MANDTTGNPLIIDTAADLASLGPMKIKSIIWSAPTAVGDDLKISDSNGNVLIETKAFSAGAGVLGEVPCGYPILDKKINIETIDGGLLYIYKI